MLLLIENWLKLKNVETTYFSILVWTFSENSLAFVQKIHSISSKLPAPELSSHPHDASGEENWNKQKEEKKREL